MLGAVRAPATTDSFRIGSMHLQLLAEGTPRAETVVPPERQSANFNFGEDVPEDLRAEIRTGVKLGVEWLLKKTAVNLQGINVHAYSSLEKVTEEYDKRKGNDPRGLEQIRKDFAAGGRFQGYA